MNIPSEKHDVGYCRPPEHSKWKKGQCGNPARIRKRLVKPAAAMIDEFFAREIDIVENGISQRRSAFGIIFLQLYNKATARNARALNVLTKYSDFAAGRDLTGGMELSGLTTRQTQKNRQEKMADYEVGYKKPPHHSRFKPGNRANPHGRGKRKLRTEAEIVNEVMNGPVEFREGSTSKRASRIELLIKSYGAAALRGDVSAAEALLKIRANFERHPAIEPAVLRLSRRDMAVC